MEQLSLAYGVLQQSENENSAARARYDENTIQYRCRSHNGLRCYQFPPAIYILLIYAQKIQGMHHTQRNEGIMLSCAQNRHASLDINPSEILKKL